MDELKKRDVIIWTLLAGLWMVLLTGCFSAGEALKQTGSIDSSIDSSVTIYVTKRGWHTGLLIPKQKVKALIPEMDADFPEASHLNFSWGEKKYFMAPKGTVILALRAALLPTQSVVHVDGLDRLPSSYIKSPGVQAIDLTSEGFQSMMVFIQKSFERDSASRLILLRENPRAMSNFYLSGITYWGTRTCNVWTARALEQAGLDLNPGFLLTAGQIMRRVKKE